MVLDLEASCLPDALWWRLVHEAVKGEEMQKHAARCIILFRTEYSCRADGLAIERGEGGPSRWYAVADGSRTR